MKGIHGRDFFVHKCESLIILLYCFVCACVKDSLQVSGREVDHEEIRMKTLFRLAPSAGSRLLKCLISGSLFSTNLNTG